MKKCPLTQLLRHGEKKNAHIWSNMLRFLFSPILVLEPND